MLRSSARAAIYADMVDLVSQRRIRGALQDAQGGVCLVGAANRATARRGGRWASLEVQQELQEELLRRSPMLRVAALRAPGAPVGSDGGLALVELWNDVPWRRTRLVVQVLSDLAQKHAAAAKDELVLELKAAVEDLTIQQAVLKDRIHELEAENRRLAEEASFWKQAWQRRRVQVSAEDLRAAFADLAELDQELTCTLSRLADETVSA